MSNSVKNGYYQQQNCVIVHAMKNPRKKFAHHYLGLVFGNSLSQDSAHDDQILYSNKIRTTIETGEIDSQ